MIRIILFRKLGELRINRKKLSEMTGIRENTLGRYYNEFATSINLEHLDLLCEVLNCGLDEILLYKPNKIPKAPLNKEKLKD